MAMPLFILDLECIVCVSAREKGIGQNKFKK
jgi:hypothetical protein